MKKLVAWAIVLILCFSISGCGNNSSEDVNSIMRTNDYKEDLIKFDDIEWLTELNIAEKKIKDDLLTTNNIYRVDLSGNEDGDEGHMMMRYDYGDNKKDLRTNIIGKIAGWDLNSIEIDYIMRNKKKYVHKYTIVIVDNEGKTTPESIKLDLIDKLDKKYGEENRVANPNYENESQDENALTNHFTYEFEWKDKNGNSARIRAYDKSVGITYRCNNIDEYLNMEKEEKSNKKKIEEENRKKEIKNNSNGL